MRCLARSILISMLVSTTACSSSQRHTPPQVAASDDTTHSDSREEGPETVTKVAMTDVPQAVQDSFKRARPDAKVTNIDKETYKNGAVHYDFDYVGADGRKSDIEFDAAGALAEH
jgi:hypothetical protein